MQLAWLAASGVRRTAAAVLVTAVAAQVAHATIGLGSGSGWIDGFVNPGLYCATLVGAALVCLTRAIHAPSERLPWSLLAVGLACWAAADIYWTASLANLDEPPYPSLADAGYLVLYPTCYAAVLMLIGRSGLRVPRSMWLDGAIVALGMAAIASALLFRPILEAGLEGDAAAIATNLAYPIGDLLLIAAVVGAFAASGWRPDRLWVVLGAGLVLSAVADSLYLARIAVGSYEAGELLDSLWPASALMIAWAAWQPRRPAEEMRLEGRRLVVVPVTFALAGLGLLVYNHFSRLNDVALVLSAATLAIVVLRMAIAFDANARMLARSRVEATTDALTGLGNRRQLMDDLEQCLRSGGARTLVLFDLDGFKRYNDAFGHPAGDALLQRLGRKLAATVQGRGRAYRMGGDEFCVLGLDGDDPSALVAASATALNERGQGFQVSASYGCVVPSVEASTAAEALQIVDQRMYGHKAGRANARTSETRDVLLQILRERQPDLHAHLLDVGQLARTIGERLGLIHEALDELARAAELHDIGKMAIPEAILDKPGPLEQEEWEFVRRHTLIGESILSAAPALVPVARLVRASHERWDGSGYPDGLAGHEIPLGARIIAVCDAYNAMTTDRAYRRAMSPEAALAEIRAGAGTQFDPEIAAVFWELVSATHGQTAPLTPDAPAGMPSGAAASRG